MSEKKIEDLFVLHPPTFDIFECCMLRPTFFVRTTIWSFSNGSAAVLRHQFRRSLFVASLWWSSTFDERKGRRPFAQRLYYIGNSRCIVVFFLVLVYLHWLVDSIVGLVFLWYGVKLLHILSWGLICLVVFCGIQNFKYPVCVHIRRGRENSYLQYVDIRFWVVCVCVILTLRSAFSMSWGRWHAESAQLRPGCGEDLE